jgi:hypothetical protein
MTIEIAASKIAAAKAKGTKITATIGKAITSLTRRGTQLLE